MKKLFFKLCVICLAFLLNGCQDNLVEQSNSEESNVLSHKIEQSMGLSSSSNNGASISNECLDEELSIFCQGPFSRTFSLEYEGCTSSVEMEIYICADPTTGNTYFVTGEIIDINTNWFTDPGCSDLMNQFLTLWINQDFDGLNDAIDDMNNALASGWQEAYVQRYIENSESKSYYCDQPNLDANIVIDNYRGTCYQRCFNTVKGQLVWNDIRCGFGCCKRTSTYCVDRETDELVVTSEIEVITECEFDPEPYPGCEYLSECRQNCAQ